MMKPTTIANLNTVTDFLIKNAHYATRSECASAKQPNLFSLLKFAVRKECDRLTEATGVNCRNICKTSRQFNYLASEAEYRLRKVFRTDAYLKDIWLAK